MKKVKYCFISPEGKVYRGYGIRTFAAEHGLQAPLMQHVHLNERKHHRQWTAPDYNEVRDD